MSGNIKNDLFLKFAGSVLALQLTACTTTKPPEQTVNHQLDGECLITTETKDGKLFPVFDRECGKHIREKAIQEIDLTYEKTIEIERTASRAAMWGALAAAIKTGKNSIVEHLGARLMIALAKHDPHAQKAADDYKIDLKNLGQRVLSSKIKYAVAGLDDGGKRASYTAHVRLLELYDGKRGEFAGMEEFARRTIDEALEKRGTDIDKVRDTVALIEMGAEGVPHLSCSPRASGRIVCSPPRKAVAIPVSDAPAPAPQ